jgi:TonB family protein
MFFKKSAFYITFLVGVSAALPLQVSALQASDFNQEYQAYKTALEAKKFDDALQHLEAAYPLAEKIYGKTSMDYANLGFSLANAIARSHPPRFKENLAQSERALALYQDGLAIYQQLPNIPATDIILHTLNACTVTNSSKVKSEFVGKALELAEAQNNPELLAVTQLQAFEIISETDKYREKHNIMLEAAYDFFHANAKTYPEKNLWATYLMAQAKFANKKLKSAEPLLLDVITQTKHLDFSHPMALAAHARLVDIYESKGKSEQATPHCVAIGSMTPWNNNQKPLPIFRREPQYPEHAARAGIQGYAKLSFTITPEGAVTNIKVVETKGSSAFGETSKAVLAKWRYAPKFENGKAVPAESMVQMDFSLSR